MLQVSFQEVARVFQEFFIDIEKVASKGFLRLFHGRFSLDVAWNSWQLTKQKEGLFYKIFIRFTTLIWARYIIPNNNLTIMNKSRHRNQSSLSLSLSLVSQDTGSPKLQKLQNKISNKMINNYGLPDWLGFLPVSFRDIKSYCVC